MANNAHKDYLIVKKEEIITSKTEEISRLNLLLKEKDIVIEQLQIQKMELQIELIKCQNNYSTIQANLDDIPLPFWIYDTFTGTITYLNQAYERDVLKPMGLTKFDVIGKRLEDVFKPETVENFKKGNKYVIDTGDDFVKVERSFTKKNQVVYWRVTKYAIYQYGKRRYIGGIAFKIKK